MSSNIEFRIDQRQILRGEKTPVSVTIQFEKPTKVRGIRAQFRGFEKTQADYTTTETNSKGESKTVTKTATQYVEIAKDDFLLMGNERKGFFSRLLDSLATWVGGGAHEIIEPGAQEFSFDVMIPNNAPASFKGKKCEVTYSVTASVDLPIKIDWSKSTDVAVPPEPIEFVDTNPVHVIFPDQTGRSFWDKTFGKDVRLNVAVDRDTLTTGETALAMLTVETPEPLKVNQIAVELVGTEKTVAQGHTDSASYRHAICQVDSPGLISNDSVHEFEIVIPELEGPASQVGTHFDISWSIEVRLHVPWAKDPVIKVPIRILPGAVRPQSGD